jgi:hypothetical protein
MKTKIMKNYKIKLLLLLLGNILNISRLSGETVNDDILSHFFMKCDITTERVTVMARPYLIFDDRTIPWEKQHKEPLGKPEEFVIANTHEVGFGGGHSGLYVVPMRINGTTNWIFRHSLTHLAEENRITFFGYRVDIHGKAVRLDLDDLKQLLADNPKTPDFDWYFNDTHVFDSGKYRREQKRLTREEDSAKKKISNIENVLQKMDIIWGEHSGNIYKFICLLLVIYFVARFRFFRRDKKP